MRAFLLWAALLVALVTLDASAQGAITGLVTSANNVAVTDASVSLYPSDTGDVFLLSAENNPQLTSNRTNNLPGIYCFFDVPPGHYRVVASKNGYEFYAVVDVDQGTSTANIVLQNYSEKLGSANADLPRRVIQYVPVNFRKAKTVSALPAVETTFTLGAIFFVAAVTIRKKGCSF